MLRKLFKTIICTYFHARSRQRPHKRVPAHTGFGMGQSLVPRQENKRGKRPALGLLVPEDKTGEVAAKEIAGNNCEIEPQDGP